MFLSIKMFSDWRFCDGFWFLKICSVTLMFCDTYIMCHKRLMTRHFVTLSFCDLMLCSWTRIGVRANLLLSSFLYFQEIQMAASTFRVSHPGGRLVWTLPHRQPSHQVPSTTSADRTLPPIAFIAFSVEIPLTSDQSCPNHIYLFFIRLVKGRTQ